MAEVAERMEIWRVRVGPQQSVGCSKPHWGLCPQCNLSHHLLLTLACGLPDDCCLPPHQTGGNRWSNVMRASQSSIWIERITDCQGWDAFILQETELLVHVSALQLDYKILECQDYVFEASKPISRLGP